MPAFCIKFNISVDICEHDTGCHARAPRTHARQHAHLCFSCASCLPTPSLVHVCAITRSWSLCSSSSCAFSVVHLGVISRSSIVHLVRVYVILRLMSASSFVLVSLVLRSCLRYSYSMPALSHVHVFALFRACLRRPSLMPALSLVLSYPTSVFMPALSLVIVSAFGTTR